MKRITLYAAAILAAFALSQCSEEKTAEEKTGLPGDNLNLYATLDLFKESKSPQAFEKSLNDKSGKVNNLDLDGNGKADYIRVIDTKEGSNHTIVLRVDVSKTESQDVAVFEIEKNADKTAHIQVIGDEDLYGKDYIIEPKNEKAAAGFVMVTNTVAVNVWAWPCITYIYSPAYVVWVSPWAYEMYPVWWEPWPVVSYEVYYPMFAYHHVYYERAPGYRFVKIHENYHYHIRNRSPYVYNKHHGPDPWKGKNPGNDQRMSGKDKNNAGKNHSDPDIDRNTGKMKNNDQARHEKQSRGKMNNAQTGKINSRPDRQKQTAGPDRSSSHRTDARKNNSSKPSGANQHTTMKKSPPAGNYASGQQRGSKGGGGKRK